MKTQIGKWPNSVLDKMDLVYVDAPFPCQGKSDVEGIFDPPYYEWFQFNKVHSFLYLEYAYGFWFVFEEKFWLLFFYFYFPRNLPSTQISMNALSI